MIARFIHLLLIVLLATLQVSLGLWWDRSTPELVLAVVIALGISGDMIDTLLWAGFGGLLLDLTLGSTPGLHLVLFSLIALTLLILQRYVLPKPSLPLALAIFTAFVLVEELLMSLIYGSLTSYILISTILTAGLATLCYYLILYIGGRKEVITLG